MIEIECAPDPDQVERIVDRLAKRLAGPQNAELRRVLIDFLPGAAALDKAGRAMNKELHQVVRDAASGKKFVDLLVRVTGRDAAERLLYVHVEVQTQRDEAFASRMFTHHHRLIDRWGQAVARREARREAGYPGPAADPPLRHAARVGGRKAE